MKRVFQLFILTFGLFYFSSGYPAQIIKTKDNKVLIVLDGTSLSMDEIVEAVDGKGNEVAKLKIVQMKGNRAIAEIVGGSPTTGLEVVKTNSVKVPEEGADILNGWYLGLGYNPAQPKFDGSFANNSGGVSSFSLLFGSSPLFVGGFENVKMKGIGYIFSFSYEPQRSVSSIAATNFAISNQSDTKVGTSGLEFGLTYGSFMGSLPYFFTLGICKQSFTFDFPGTQEVSGSSLGYLVGISSLVQKKFTVDILYKSITDSSSATGASGSLSFNGPQIRAGYVF